jgi:hypothetical protein
MPLPVYALPYFSAVALKFGSKWFAIFMSRLAFEKMREFVWPGAASGLQGIRYRHDQYSN